jgi:DNA processing protein
LRQKSDCCRLENILDPSKYSLAARILSLKMTGHVGPRTFEILMSHFKTVDNILLAEEEELMEVDGIGRSRSKAIFEANARIDQAQTLIDHLKTDNTEVSTCLDEDYPEILHQLNDPPPLLYYKGRLPANAETRAAIIGSQDVSAEGIGDAVELARRLSEEGTAIVGGLARGIDTAGHMGALKADGITYAVLPSGFNHIHPSENEMLCGEIIERGGLISEYLPDTPANAGRLMSRNRLIVGLSQAVIIGEVSTDSVGTLDAALCCHQLGKLLFAVIGKNNPHYEKLAEYGAIPLTHINEYKMIVKSLV